MSRAVAVLAILVVISAAAGASHGQVVVNEVMADPASDWNGDSTYSYRDDEWVEIYNAGNERVDLAPYWLSDSDSTLLFNFCGFLGARRHRVVFGSEVVEWQRANGVSAAGLRLNNSGDAVMLWIISGGTGAACGASDSAPGSAAPAPVLMDEFEFLNHEAEDDRSSGLVPDGGGGRALFDGLNPYTGGLEPQGNGCTPTPGGHNGCATAVEGRSWGSIKALYR
jgi:hypothetical protein